MRHLRTYDKQKLFSPAEVEDLVCRLSEEGKSLPLELIYLHGAHARGVQTPLSDLDIAVLLVKEKARDRHCYSELLERLQSISGRDDVDLVILNTAGPIIKDRVVRYGRLVYARTEKERILFEASAIKEAIDFRYFSSTYDDALFDQISEGRYLG